MSETEILVHKHPDIPKTENEIRLITTMVFMFFALFVLMLNVISICCAQPTTSPVLVDSGFNAPGVGIGSGVGVAPAGNVAIGSGFNTPWGVGASGGIGIGSTDEECVRVGDKMLIRFKN